MKWAYTQAGVVVKFYEKLPDSWESYSNFYALEFNDPTQLNSIGWYKVITAPYSYDASTQFISNVVYNFYPTYIEEVYTIANNPLPPP